MQGILDGEGGAVRRVDDYSQVDTRGPWYKFINFGDEKSRDSEPPKRLRKRIGARRALDGEGGAVRRVRRREVRVVLGVQVARDLGELHVPGTSVYSHHVSDTSVYSHVRLYTRPLMGVNPPFEDVHPPFMDVHQPFIRVVLGVQVARDLGELHVPGTSVCL